MLRQNNTGRAMQRIIKLTWPQTLLPTTGSQLFTSGDGKDACDAEASAMSGVGKDACGTEASATSGAGDDACEAGSSATLVSLSFLISPSRSKTSTVTKSEDVLEGTNHFKVQT